MCQKDHNLLPILAISFDPHSSIKLPIDLWCICCETTKVGHLGEQYEEWVHQPIVSKEGPRFFENDFMEVTYLCLFANPMLWKDQITMF